MRRGSVETPRWLLHGDGACWAFGSWSSHEDRPVPWPWHTEARLSVHAPAQDPALRLWLNPCPWADRGGDGCGMGRQHKKKPCEAGASCHLLHPTVARGPQTTPNPATSPALLTAALSPLRFSEQRGLPRARQRMGIRSPGSLLAAWQTQINGLEH